MTSQVLKDRIATIQKSNAKFLKMTKAEKRVVVAKDVIAQIEARRLTPTNLAFVEAPNGKFTQNDDEDMRDVLLTVPQCNVCACGALFVCAVERLDKLPVKDFCYEADDYMAQLFTPKQWALIECAFELWGSAWVNDRAMKTLDAEAFGAKYADPADRMLAIMRNIVKNHGTFKP